MWNISMHASRILISISLFACCPLLLHTQTANLGRVIDQNTIEELPPVNRNFTEILGLTEGVNTDITVYSATQ